MNKKDSVWFRIGYGLEVARRHGRKPRRLKSLSERIVALPRTDPGRKPTRPDAEELPFDAIIVAGLTAAGARILQRWPRQGQARFARLLRAGAAGAAAALVRQVLHPLMEPGDGLSADGQELANEMLVGAGQGLIYGTLLEPLMPGPPVVRGLLFGAAEYVLAPLGGLARVLGSAAPQSKVPLLEKVMAVDSPLERSLRDQMLFGTALAVLYGSTAGALGDDNSGISMEK